MKWKGSGRDLKFALVESVGGIRNRSRIKEREDSEMMFGAWITRRTVLPVKLGEACYGANFPFWKYWARDVLVASSGRDAQQQLQIRIWGSEERFGVLYVDLGVFYQSFGTSIPEEPRNSHGIEWRGVWTLHLHRKDPSISLGNSGKEADPNSVEPH